MPESPNIAELHPLIEQGVELLRVLETQLASERQALEQRDLDAMTRCNEEKAALLAQIDANFRTRHEWLSAQGVELSAEGWQQFLQQLPADQAEQLDAHWQQLAETLERVQKASLINQQLVRRGQENTERLLSILQGKNQRSQLYGRSGQSSSFATQSRLGKA
jgi:flagellar biosynthesis/type III secretory pathway chaperone